MWRRVLRSHLLAVFIIVVWSGIIPAGRRFTAAPRERPSMDTLKIRWQRLVAGGSTCRRCEATGDEVRKAAATLEQVLAPLGIRVVLEEVVITPEAFERQPLESNRVLIEGRAVEAWLGGSTGQSPCCDVCGPHPCRTLTVDGRTHEAVPADVIVRAGLMAAASPAATPEPPPAHAAHSGATPGKVCCS